jgi:hypothetical protein
MPEFSIGDFVELHCDTMAWREGQRYGYIVALGPYVSIELDRTQVIETFRPDEIHEVIGGKTLQSIRSQEIT